MAMDTSDMHADKVTNEGGWHFGEKDAPVKVVEFINLRCPYCKLWWEKAAKVIDPYVEEGKVERIVKHFDKEKPSLRKGNVFHHHIDYQDDPKEIREKLDTIFERQGEWGDLEEDEVLKWAKEEIGLGSKMNAEESKKIFNEAENANVFFVPSIFIEDYIFDENIEDDELESIIKVKLQK